MKPLLLLDVDGPLNPYRQITKKGYLPPKKWAGQPPYGYEKHLMRPPGWETGKALPVLISREMGEDLAALSGIYTLVWASTWEDAANELLSPLLGLPELPVITWPTNDPGPPLPPNRRGGSWKTRHILNWLDEHHAADGTHLPWMWVDDEIRAVDRTLLREHYGEQRGDPQRVQRCLFHVEPKHGLRRHDLADLRQWAENVHS